jgi:hypothetical protein
MFLNHAVQTGPGAHPARVQWVPRAISQQAKRPEREAAHSPPSTVDVKNGGAKPPLPHMSSWLSKLIS